MKIPFYIIAVISTIIEMKFPLPKFGRPRRTNNKYIIEKIIKVLITGTQWRELHSPLLSPKTINNYFNKWSKKGIFELAYKKILSYLKTKFNHQEIYFATDTTFIKNIFGIDCCGKNPTDRGRKATKISVVVDHIGIPYSLQSFPANKNDCLLLKPTFDNAIIPLKKNIIVYADKAYDTQTCRKYISDNSFFDGVLKKGKVYNEYCQKRNIVERFFAWFKMFRRIILRFEKNITNYLSFCFISFCIITSKKFI